MGLQQELVNNPPDPRKKKKKTRPTTSGGAAAPKRKEKQRTESLILLQKDLFIMTTTTVFRSLEEQYYPVTQELKEQFNPNVMYEKALENDIPWRNWQKWIEKEVIAMMNEEKEKEGGSKEAEKPVAAPTSAAAENKDKDCSIQ